MRLYIFQSETKPELNAFAGDEKGTLLPQHHGPWKVTGIVGANSAPPHKISRRALEDAIVTHGFQLWRAKPVLAA